MPRPSLGAPADETIRSRSNPLVQRLRALKEKGVRGSDGLMLLEGGKLGYTTPTFEGDGSFTFLTYPHPMLHDGRGANKPWLMENADPVTKITWHSWVEVSPAAARASD